MQFSRRQEGAVARCMVDAQPGPSKYRFGIVPLDSIAKSLQSMGRSIEEYHENVTLRHEIFRITTSSQKDNREQEKFTTGSYHHSKHHQSVDDIGLNLRELGEIKTPDWPATKSHANGMLVCRAANVIGWQPESAGWCMTSVVNFDGKYSK